MFDYFQIAETRQRHEEIVKRANAPEPEGWTHPVPNIFDKLFAKLRTRRAGNGTPTPTVYGTRNVLANGANISSEQRRWPRASTSR